MPLHTTLSELAALVQDTLEERFWDKAFWVKAELTDVKLYPQKQWCFCRLVEKQGTQVATQMEAVFWANGFQHIRRFEQLTGTRFDSGLEISCLVTVKYHPRYGLKLEVLEIDQSFALGKLELERQQTLERLLKTYPAQIRQEDGAYRTFNNTLALPAVLQRVALVTAPGSDGQRDFVQELAHNPYGYHIDVTGYLCTVQGEQAAALIRQQLLEIYQRASDYDCVVLVRGGGSQTDFKPFDDYELARTIALFPIPVFTGIGHDRNTSIADLMARQLKTPTKVAATIIDHNFRFESAMMELRDRLMQAAGRSTQRYGTQLAQWQQRLQWLVPQRVALRRQTLERYRSQVGMQAGAQVRHRLLTVQQQQALLQRGAQARLEQAGQQLQQLHRLVAQLSPQAVLNRGFAMLMQQEKVITSGRELKKEVVMQTITRDATVTSTIQEIIPYEPTDI